MDFNIGLAQWHAEENQKIVRSIILDLAKFAVVLRTETI